MAERMEKEQWPDFLHKLKELKHQVRPLESKRAAEYELFLVNLSEWRLRLPTHTPLIWVKGEMAKAQGAAELAAGLRDIASERGWRNQVCLALLDGDGRALRAEMIGWYAPRFILIDAATQRRIMSANSFTFATLDAVCEQTPISTLAPYEMGASVEGSRFFGRETEIHRILGRPETNFAITGVRRIGKTSLMKEIRRRMIEQGEPAERIAWLDCSILEHSDQFEQEIVRQLRFRELLRLDRQVHFSLADFLGRMRKMYGGRITVFLDEVDKMLDWAREHLSTILRSSANTDDCRYIMAGYQRLMREHHDNKSPLYLAMETLRLGPFERKETEEIVLRPMRSLRVKFEHEQEVVSRIYSDTRGNPLLVQYYCTQLIKQLEKSGTLTINLACLEEIYKGRGFKDQVLSSFSQNVDARDKLLVYAVLASYAESKESFTQEEMYGAMRKHKVFLSADQINSSCNQLELAGVLISDGLRYEFAIPVFPRALRANSNLDYLFSATRREVGL